MNLQIVYNIEASRAILFTFYSWHHLILRHVDVFLKDLTEHIANVFDVPIDVIISVPEVCYTLFFDIISSIRLPMPDGDEITGDQIWDVFIKYILDFVFNLHQLYRDIGKLVAFGLLPYIKEGKLEIDLAFPFQH